MNKSNGILGSQLLEWWSALLSIAVIVTQEPKDGHRSSTLMSNTPVLMLIPPPWQGALGLPLGTWCFPTESSIHPLEQRYMSFP